MVGQRGGLRVESGKRGKGPGWEKGEGLRVGQGQVGKRGKG